MHLPNRLQLLAALPQSPLSPCYFSFVCDPERKWGKIVGFLRFAYRFLSIRMITKPTTTMATIMPSVAGSKYMSAVDGGIGVGSGVA